MTQTSQFERERAKRLYAAIMSSQKGTAFSTEYKHIGNSPIAGFWFEWAELISRKWNERMDARIAELLKPEKEERIH